MAGCRLNHKSSPSEGIGLAGTTQAGSPRYLKDFGNVCQRSLVWSQLRLLKSHHPHLPPLPVKRTEQIISKITSGCLNSKNSFPQECATSEKVNISQFQKCPVMHTSLFPY